MSAITDYKTTTIKIFNEVNVLMDKLKKHNEQFNHDVRNYGYVGDLNRVLTELKQLNESLS